MKQSKRLSRGGSFELEPDLRYRYTAVNAILFSLFLFQARFSTAQKYSFVNWSVEEGLIQSQAQYIVQGTDRELWVGTIGGLSRFDGHSFKNYYPRRGLESNSISGLKFDHRGDLWIGSSDGITIFDGNRFETVSLPAPVYNMFTSFCPVSPGRMFGLDIFKRIYEITGRKAKALCVSGDTTEVLTCLVNVADSRLLAYVHKRGFYVYDGSWKPFGAEHKDRENYVQDILITGKGDTLLRMHRGIFVLKNGIVQSSGKLKAFHAEEVSAIMEDSDGNIWIGRNRGAAVLKEDEIVYFTESSGFTDNQVNFIFEDADRNIWFATEGSGIFKYREESFRYYDKSNGLRNHLISGIAEDSRKNMIISSFSDDLYRMNTDHTLLKLDLKGLSGIKINSIYTTTDNSIWLSSWNQGIWRLSASGQLSRMSPDAGEPQDAICFAETKHGIIIGNGHGLFFMDKNGKASRIDFPDLIVTGFLKWNNDTFFVSTGKGLYLLPPGRRPEKFGAPELQDLNCVSIGLSGTGLLIGTSGRGLFRYDLERKTVKNFNYDHGLPNDYIYSIVTDHLQNIWLGTGFGICRLRLSANGELTGIRTYGRADGLLGMECSMNASIFSSDSTLWFGTNKGLFLLQVKDLSPDTVRQAVYLKSVKLFSQSVEDTSLFRGKQKWSDVPEGLSLPHRENHLTFEIGTTFFGNSDALTFEYLLSGLDDGFTKTKNRNIIYTSLPPGSYTFIARSVAGFNRSASLEYPFTIRKPFYQTSIFVFFITLLCAAGLLGTAWYRMKRQSAALLARQRIRQEESELIREQTAEDFHDDMGNRLTRISLMAEMLKNRKQIPQQEFSSLLSQISSDSKELYTASREIIRSLDPKNDLLHSFAEHLREMGTSVFRETGIRFTFTHNVSPTDPTVLTFVQNRNLRMIVKEIYTNCLKHSGATATETVIRFSDADRKLELTISDNGKGWDPESANTGNGLVNMKKRAKRILAELAIQTETGKGSSFLLKLGPLNPRTER